LHSHEGDIHLVEVRDSVAYLRLEGTCRGCPFSSRTMKLAIEDALYEAAPEIVGIEADGLVQPPAPRLVPLPLADGHGAGEGGHGWVTVTGLPDLPPGEVVIHTVAGRTLVFCRLGAQVYAYESRCPACQQSLAGAELEGEMLACPRCGARFDVHHAGRPLAREEVGLEPVPLLREGSEVKVAMVALG
jgi:nitrite reductase/ring-hydroxylating ferredoxin subunit